MLRYLSTGWRESSSYRHQSHLEKPRGNWEFYAVTSGHLWIDVAGQTGRSRKVEKRLMLFPPDSLHQWHLLVGESCQVFVAHFTTLPECVRGLMSDRKMAYVELSAADIKLLEEIYREIRPHFLKPSVISNLFFDRAILDLSILLFSKQTPPLINGQFSKGSETVQNAVAYFEQHISEGPSFDEIAKGVGCSVRQLRRDFLKYLDKSPKDAFAEISFRNACELLADTNRTLKEIAFASGYKGFAQFYRAFKARYQISPSEWRKGNNYLGLGISIKR